MRIFAMLLIFITAVTAETRVDKYIGTAVDLKTGTLIYTEEHEALYNNDINVSTVITYRDGKKNIIGKKEIFFNGTSPAAKFRRDDYRYGTMESAEIIGNAVKLVSKPDASAAAKEELVTIPSPLALDAGLNNMVRNNWEKLRRNEIVTFNLGVPSQLDYFEFRVIKEREETFVGKNTMVVRFESDHWYIRLFVDPVVVWYDMETRRAVKYEGISNIYDDKGKSYLVRVTFDKPGP
jgi:hypothetical protein